MEDIPLLSDLYDAINVALPRKLRPYLDPALWLVLAATLAVILRLTVFRGLRKLAAGNESRHDDIVVDVVARRIIGWVVLGVLLNQIGELPWKARSIAWAEDIVAALLILSVTAALVRIATRMAEAYGSGAAAGYGGTTLIRYLSTTILVFIGVVSVLALFGISVVPAITALGVGGLAVALAFQDTLANVFAGINMTLARQIRVGDYIDLQSGVEGTIVDIGWRTTTLRAVQGPQVHIPNKKLAESVMINYSRPSSRVTIEMIFPVPHASDADRVEEVLIDEIKGAVPEVPGLVSDEPPFVRFRSVADSALEFRAYATVLNYEDRFAIRHTLMKRLHRRLRTEGIVIPAPQREVRLVGQTPSV
jgi:small-conductance mechanosensitive channel